MLPQHVLLLTPHNSGLIAVSGSAAYRIDPDGKHHRTRQHPNRHQGGQRGAVRRTVWIYATGQDGKVYLSQDSGQELEAQSLPRSGQTSGHFEAIAASDRHPEVAYAGFRGLQIGEGKENLFNGIAKTMDGGQSWKIVFKESNQARGQPERKLDRAARPAGQPRHLVRLALQSGRSANQPRRSLRDRPLPHLSHPRRRRNLAGGELQATQATAVGPPAAWM
jgi:hypothetical protein